MDAISAERIARLYPELARRWTQIDAGLVASGITVRVTQGLRTWAEQDALFAQGRTTPGRIVTFARGGESWHNYGLALDFVPMVAGAPMWAITHPWWAATIAAAQAWGLFSGSTWPDPKTDTPHLQLTLPYDVDKPSADVQALWRQGGESAVWLAMNQYRGIATASAFPGAYVCNPNS